MNKYLIATMMVLCVTMTVCSVNTVLHPPTEEEIRESIEAEVQNSIEQDTDYQQFQQLKSEGKLTYEGIYVDSDLEAEKEANAANEGKNHVTFAVNSHLDVQYFYDAELTQPITSDCWLEPGTSIYAPKPEAKHTEIAAYEFDMYRICEYDIKGERTKTYSANYSEENLVYQLPDDASVKELSIEPLGKYTKRKYNLKASLDNISTGISGGQWYVNGQPKIGDMFEAEPSVDCNVKYTFPESDYYCIEDQCSPAPQTVNDSAVVFEKITASNTNVDTFVVVLGKKIHTSIDLQDKDIVYSLTVNGKKQDISKDHEYAFVPGDQVIIAITVQNGTEMEIVSDDISQDSVRSENNSIIYSYTIPTESDKPLEFSIKKKEIKKETKEIEVVTSGWAGLNLFSQNEADLVHVTAGKKVDYDFNQLKAFLAPKTIEPDATDELKIQINDSIKLNPNIRFRIKLNGENDQFFTKYSNEMILTRSCEKLDKVEIYLETGYVFEEDIIHDSNQDLQNNIKYYYEDGNEVKKGDFLKGSEFLKGNKIRVVAENIPDGYTITGGAIKKGETEGSIKITDNTKASDFVVNYEKQ